MQMDDDTNGLLYEEMETVMMFETASFHIVKPCNMACKFCYATFDDMRVKELSLSDAQNILVKLKEAGLQKITFAGGEPMLYSHILQVIEFSKESGLTTSIITNGSLLSWEWLEAFQGKLDWIGLSIDSLNTSTNQLIGRRARHNPDYHELVSKIKRFGFKLKINTVVNRYNWQEDMNDFINWATPDRWKVFQALRVEGQNDKQFDEIRITDGLYQRFISQHSDQKAMVVEDNKAMTGSYLLIDPQGRLFENSKGRHTYSSPLQNNPIEKCLSEINLNREMFIERGGIYNW